MSATTTTATTDRPPRCRLAAANGNLHVLIFTVEQALLAAGLTESASTFRAEVDEYLAYPEANYRTILGLASRYVTLC